MLFEITQRLKILAGDDEHPLGQKMLMMEVLSDNRNLTATLKEVEAMLRDITLERLPSYEIGLEKGITVGIQKGIAEGLQEGELKGKLASAAIMITEYGVSAETVAQKLGIPLDRLKDHLKQH